MNVYRHTRIRRRDVEREVRIEEMRYVAASVSTDDNPVAVLGDEEYVFDAVLQPRPSRRKR